MIGCQCSVCLSEDTRDQRLRTSAIIHFQEYNFLIDIGPDFRQQMISNQLSQIDAILLTHPHRDHVGGFDDIRALNFLYEQKVALYANNETWTSLKKQFYYAFMDSDYTSNPKVNFHPIDSDSSFYFNEVQINPIQVMHGKMPCLGYRVGNLAYITDANYIEDAEIEKLQNLDVLVLNSLRKTKHPSHFTLEESIEMISKINPKKTYLIHLSHHMGKHNDVSSELPENVLLAYDGLKVEF